MHTAAHCCTVCNCEKVETTLCRVMDELRFIHIMECQPTVKTNNFCILRGPERLCEMTNVAQMGNGKCRTPGSKPGALFY